MQKKHLATLLGLCFLSTTVNASPYGVNVSYLVLDKDPQYLKGYRLSFLYNPPAWAWNHLHIFWDFSAGHWWVRNNVPYQELNILSIAPVFRFYFINTSTVSPFADLSVGVAYLSKTRISDRNLGMHFSFQDQVGLGVSFGKEKHLSVSIDALHYSNGSLCAMNAGITVPIMLNVSYQF